MKKNLVVSLIVIITAVAIAFGVITDIQYYKYKDEQNYLKVLETVAAYSNSESLGLVDIGKVSQDDGYWYSGPAIHRELCARAGIPEESDTWAGFVEYYRDIAVCTFTVYEEGQEDVPTFQRKVKARYIYGEI